MFFMAYENSEFFTIFGLAKSPTLSLYIQPIKTCTHMCMHTYTLLTACPLFKNQSIIPLRSNGNMTGKLLLMIKILFFLLMGSFAFQCKDYSLDISCFLFCQAECSTMMLVISLELPLYFSMCQIHPCLESPSIIWWTSSWWNCSLWLLFPVLWTHQAYSCFRAFIHAVPCAQIPSIRFLQAESFVSFGIFASISSNILLS